MMSQREVWIKAGAILAEHGAMAGYYIIGQLSDVMGCDDAEEDWRRVAAAVDAITGAKSQ